MIGIELKRINRFGCFRGFFFSLILVLEDFY